MKSASKKLLFQLILHTALIVPIYFLIAERLEFPYIHYIYLLAGTVLLFYYVIYNRGFVAKNATIESLPNTMTDEEKRAFIEDGKARQTKSRWVLTIFIPIVITFLADAALLYIVPSLEAMLT